VVCVYPHDGTLAAEASHGARACGWGARGAVVAGHVSACASLRVLMVDTLGVDRVVPDVASLATE